MRFLRKITGSEMRYLRKTRNKTDPDKNSGKTTAGWGMCIEYQRIDLQKNI